jgi:hypothetical protein
MGSRCKFSHEKHPKKDAAATKEQEYSSGLRDKNGGFKTLYQRWVEQEKEEEERMVVRAVKLLFDQGKLGSLT